MTPEIIRIIFDKFLEAGGVWGVVVIVLCFAIYKLCMIIISMWQTHRADRDKWLERLFTQEEKRIDVDKERIKMDLKHVEVLGQIKILVNKLID